MPVAIVTGSSSGIGKGIAIRLAADGFTVIVNDLPSRQSVIDATVKELAGQGYKVHGISGDVSKKEDVVSLVQQTVEKFGELNAMVANAAILTTSRMVDASVEEFDKVMAVNVRGVFLCYQAAAKQMIKQGKGGKIVGACSVGAYKPSGKTFVYAVSKYAVRGLTQTSALELGEFGINVNCYCPGAVKTEIWETLSKRLIADTNPDATLDDVFDAQAKISPLKGPVLPRDIAAVVSFLCSEDSRYMTGQSLICDGGRAFT